MPRRILLTGASGFIGKALHAHLLKRGDVDVIAVSRHHGIDMASEDWPRLLPDVAVDTVFHLAQSGGYRHFPEQAADMRRVNIDATAQLLEWSRLHQVGRFIFASTGNVYKPADHALAENDPTLPASFYGATKLCAEHLVAQYQGFFPVINARLFGVYGPGQRSMLIPDLVERLLGRQEIVLARGTGLMFTPLFIQDCVEIISALASLRLSGSSLVMNMAGDRTIGLNQVVEMLEKLLDTRALLRHTAEPAAFMVANIEKFKALFSDFALTAPEDGFRKLVAGGRHV
jgi:UDP-glucose 4-epimerase